MSGTTHCANSAPPLTAAIVGATALADGSLFDSIPLVKRCSKCGEDKLPDQFNKCRGKLRAYCRACHVRLSDQWQRANRDKVRAHSERRRRAMGQKPRCAIPTR
jgi:predicted sulfurtransferase